LKAGTIVTSRILSILSGALLIAAAAGAQSPQPPASTAPAAAAPAAPASPDAAAALESPGYTYDPQGRRDPFVSLLRRGLSSDESRPARPAGISGLETSEVTLKGTMQSRTGYVALVEATDKKTYIIKTGDRLLDGTVRTITASAMVILQEVHDPLSLEKQREVRKMLRQTDEVK
jgi:type IV pilus assembly protein PilP